MKSYLVIFAFPNGSQTRLDIASDDFVLVAAYRAGLDLPSMCLQGWCISCAGRVNGEGEWDQSASRRYFPEDRVAGYILLCTAKPCSDLLIHTHQRVAMRDYRVSLNLPTPRR